MQTTQVLLLIIGGLVSALLTLILAQLNSIREDGKKASAKMEDFVTATAKRFEEQGERMREQGERFVKLRTEHEDQLRIAAYCGGKHLFLSKDL